jgi:hypothetical protein
MSSDDLRPDGTDLDRHEGEPGAVIDIHEPIYREQAEPKDGYEPVPLWLMFAALTLMGFGGWYLGMYSGGFRADIGEARQSHQEGRRDARRWAKPTEDHKRPTPPQGGEPERRRDQRRTRRQAGVSKNQPRHRRGLRIHQNL